MTQVANSSKIMVFQNFLVCFLMFVEGAAVKAGKKIPCFRMMNKQMFTLSNKLPSLSSDKFQQMRTFPTDCTLVCSNGRVGAHKLILAAASSFFLAHISGGLVFLPHYDARDVGLIVDFIYGQTVTVDYDTMARLVAIAQDMGLNAFANDGAS